MDLALAMSRELDMPITLVELILRLGASVAPGRGNRLRAREARAAGRVANPPARLAGVGDLHARLDPVRLLPALQSTTSVVRVDTSRIASNVVVGIGFLGGGAILQAGSADQGTHDRGEPLAGRGGGPGRRGGMFVAGRSGHRDQPLRPGGAKQSSSKGSRQCSHLRVRIDTEGDFLHAGAAPRCPASVGRGVTDVDYARDSDTQSLSDLTSTSGFLPVSLEEPMVKILESLPARSEGLRMHGLTIENASDLPAQTPATKGDAPRRQLDQAEAQDVGMLLDGVEGLGGGDAVEVDDADRLAALMLAADVHLGDVHAVRRPTSCR